MPRTYSIQKTVYTWDELSDSAKDTARQEWNRFLWDDGSMQESMAEIWESTLTDAGWTDLADLSYAIAMQGGYPEWSGTLAGFEHGGKTWTVIANNRRGNMSIHVEDPDDDYTGEQDLPACLAAEEAARDLVSELSHKLYWAFIAEDEYQTSDEVMAETAEANGYEYDEDGHLS